MNQLPLTGRFQPVSALGQSNGRYLNGSTISGIAGFGYLGHATLLTALKVDPSVVAPSTLSLKADATWLACSGVCVPDEGSVSIPLQIEAGVWKAGANPTIAHALKALPRPAPWPIKAARVGDTLVVTAGPRLDMRTLKSARYFPYDGALIANGAEQDFRLENGTLAIADQAGAQL